MLHLDYEFTAMYFANHHVSISIAPRNTAIQTFPENPPLENTTALWDDITQCFTQGRFYGVARTLYPLPYKQTLSGTIDVLGPLKKRKEIFDLLTPYRDERDSVNLAVRIKFFRFPQKTPQKTGTVPDMTVEHWVGRTWNTERDHESFPALIKKIGGDGEK